MIHTILFDLDDTLLDFRAAERAALSQTLLHLGIEPTEEILTLYSRLNAEQWKLLEQCRITIDEVRVRRYRLLFDALGIDHSPEDATDHYEALLATRGDLMDGAEELLRTLIPRYRLYIASNGYRETQWARIHQAGIASYFQGVFLSQEIGAEKPSPAFFDHCFAHIPQFQKESTVMVGDSLSSDIKGGHDAGLRTIWLNRKGLPIPGNPAPDHQIFSLSQLPGLLASL